MSDTPKKKPPKLGPKKTNASPAQSSAQKSTPAPKKASTSTEKPTSSKSSTAAPKTSASAENKPPAKTSTKQPAKKLPPKQPAKETPAETSQKKPAQPADPKSKSEGASTKAPSQPSQPKKQPTKLPPKKTENQDQSQSPARKPSNAPRKPSTDTSKKEAAQEKSKPSTATEKPDATQEKSKPSTATKKPEATQDKSKPPKLGHKKDGSATQTPARKQSVAPTTATESRGTSAAPTASKQASRRPSAMPRQSSQATAKKQTKDAGLDTPSKKEGEQQDLNSVLSDEQRADLIQLVASITRQMRKTIEDDFDASATLKSLGLKEGEDRKNMTEDEKIMANFDTGSVNVDDYEKEKKLRDERQKEINSPKIKQLKKTALEWFDEWQKIVQERVKEQVGPAKEISKTTSEPSAPEGKPIQKVNTDAKTGEYSPPKLEELFPRLKTSLTKLSLKERQVVLHSMLLLMLSLEHYNAASRVLLLYLTSSLKLGLKHLREDEETTAQGLLKAAKQISADEEVIKKKKLEGQEAHKWRVRLATAAGAAVVGVSGGLAAPMIAAGVGTVMSGIGLEATAAASYLGSVAGSTYLVGGLFGAYGGRMTGDIMKELSAEVEDFAFLPVHGERKDHGDSVDAATESRRLRVIIAISGWLLEKEEVVTPWKVLKPSAEVFALRFELEALMNLGQSIDTMISSAAYGYAQSAMIKQTVFAELMSAMWPVALVKVARVVDNPFTLAKTRADKAGKVLAEALINRTQGERPVTLIGYSLGARVIWSCLTTLAEKRAFGLVESAVLIGSPLPSDVSTWRTMRTAVSGRLVNVYSENDYLLAFLYRTSSLQYGVAGLMPISGLYDVENVDVSETVSGHLRYRYLVGSILQKIGFEDIDKAEVDKEAEAFKKVVEEESKHGYIQQAKDGYQGKKTGQAPKKQKAISDAEADKQASAMEKEVAAKTQKGLYQWAVEQLYISAPSVPTTSDVKGAAADPQGAAKGTVKDTGKTANKTIDAATKTLYQRAKDAVYLSRSGGIEGEKAAQEKLSQAQEAAPSGYLATAAGYIPTSYIPGLGGAGSAKKAAPKLPVDASKPPLKKTASSQKKLGEAAKPALKKTESMQKKAGDAAKDPAKAAGDIEKNVEDIAKDPSKGASDTAKQAAGAGKTTTDTASAAGKAVGDAAGNVPKATADATKDAPKAATGAAKDPKKAAGDASKTATDTASGAGKQAGDAAKSAGGMTSYIPSFGFGKAKGAVPGMAAAGIKPRQSNIDALLAGAEASGKKEEKPPEKKKKTVSAASKPAGDAQKKAGDATGSAKKASGGYTSYIPSFGFGGSKTPSKDAPKPQATAKDASKKNEEATGETKKTAAGGTDSAKEATDDVASKTPSKDAPKPEESLEDASKKTEDAAGETKNTATEGTNSAKEATDDVASKTNETTPKGKGKDSNSDEDIFTSPPSKGANALANAASGASTSATDAAGSAGKSVTDAAGGAGKSVGDTAKGAQKYTPKIGGVGGDAGDKVGEMTGGAASGAKSGVSAVGGGAASGAKSGVSALGGAGKGLAGLAGAGGGGGSKAKENDGGQDQASKESDDVSDADSEETERPGKVKDSGPDSDESGGDSSGDGKDDKDTPESDSDSDEGEDSRYDSANEEAGDEAEESMQVGGPDAEGEDEEAGEKEASQNGESNETGPKEEEPKEEEQKGYLGAAGDAASGAGSGVASGVGSVGKGAASGAGAAGSAVGGAASGAASGVSGGVGKLGKGLGWG